MKAFKYIAAIFGVCLVVSLVGGFHSEKLFTGGSDRNVNDVIGVRWAEAQEAVSPYDKEIEALTTIECGQCHYSIFQALKKSGGLHRIDCVRCHREYHVYNPRKQNYDEIMPECIWCHQSPAGGPFHGDEESLPPCLNCHADPHKPLMIPMGELYSTCAACHAEQGQEVKDYPSMHTEVPCADCHAEKHGYIPGCDMCHESHSPAVEMSSADCMSCHPVHKPTQIAYEADTDSLICAGCHGGVYQMLQDNVTAHTSVPCAECHPSHGEALSCADCHGQPHPASMNATNCGECHGIAHDLAL